MYLLLSVPKIIDTQYKTFIPFQGDDLTSPNGKKRKKIRKVLKDKKLKEETKSAAKAEEERRKRISERQKLVS